MILKFYDNKINIFVVSGEAILGAESSVKTVDGCGWGT